jgi:hypothetical protein
MLSSVIVSIEPEAKSDSDRSGEQRRWLSRLEVPFLLTVLIGLLCWCVTYFTDGVKKLPTISYSKINSDNGVYFYLYPRTQTASQGRNEVGYEITNLTRDQVFKDVSFYIIARKGRLSDGTLLPIAPAKISDRSPTAPRSEGPSLIRYRLPEFHPGWKFRLLARLAEGGTQNDIEISFDYSDRSDFGQKSDLQVAPVRFVEASLETFVVEHDFEIVGMLFVSGLIGIGLYMVLAARNQ